MNKPLNLPSRLDGPSAEQLAPKLAEITGKPLVLNGADVTFGGALGLQFLVSARRRWHQDDVEFEITNASDALRDSCRTLGIDPEEIGVFEIAGAVQ